MQARTAFGNAWNSKNIVAILVALLLLGFMLGGAGGYLLKGVNLPVASQIDGSAPQAYTVSDASTRSQRGGPQTVETQTAGGTTTSNPGPRHSGLQLP
jgi:hypothetical protein